MTKTQSEKGAVLQPVFVCVSQNLSPRYAQTGNAANRGILLMRFLLPVVGGNRVSEAPSLHKACPTAETIASGPTPAAPPSCEDGQVT